MFDPDSALRVRLGALVIERSSWGSNLNSHHFCQGKKRRFVFQRTFGCGDGIWTSWPSGYEPDELPDCSTPRYNGAGSRDRTGTRSKSHGILSPGRLPVPPFRHKCDRTSSILPIHYSTSLLFCQYPFWKKYFSRRFFAPFLLTRGKKCDIIYRLVWYIVCPVSWIYSHFVGENKLNSW